MLFHIDVMDGRLHIGLIFSQHATGGCLFFLPCCLDRKPECFSSRLMIWMVRSFAAWHSMPCQKANPAKGINPGISQINNNE